MGPRQSGGRQKLMKACYQGRAVDHIYSYISAKLKIFGLWSFSSNSIVYIYIVRPNIIYPKQPRSLLFFCSPTTKKEQTRHILCYSR